MGVIEARDSNRYRRWCRDAMPACRVGFGAQAFQVIANATWTSLDFGLEYFDTFGMHSVAANTDRITFRIPGRYMVGGSINWGSVVSDRTRRILSIALNGIVGAGTEIAGFEGHISNAGAVGMRQTISTFREFVLGDYVTLCVFQNSGGNLNITQATEYCPIFWAQRTS